MFFSSGFPFGEFDSGHSERPKKEVDTKRFYEILGVDKDASAAEIKKQYRRLAVQHHPDKGGDPDVFKDVSRAYEVLSDPEKRGMYDQHGEDGLDGSGGAEAHDIFDLFFGGGGKRKGPAMKKKGENIVSPLKVTLSQLYKGATRKLAVNRDVLCPQCHGIGGPKEAIEKCHACDGAGVRIQIRQMGPMIQQIQSKCSACAGEGSSIPANKKCTQCKGNKTTKERKIVEIYVEPGAPNQHKCVFKGQADHRPGEEPGDVVFVLDEQDHPLFKRKNVDLFVEREITLFEALTGYKFLIESLDDRKLLIQNHVGEITKPGDIRCVRSEGMPTHRSPFVKGDLFVVFTIAFPTPEQMSCVPKAFDQLKNILPNPEPLMVDEDSNELEHHFVENIKPQDRAHSSRGEAYDEDEDGYGGSGQRVQCRQQ